MLKEMSNNRCSVFRTTGLKMKIVGIALSITALIIAFAIYESKTTGIYKYVFILPLLFTTINFLFLNIYNRLTIVTIIVITMEFIRYVLTPLVLMIENYPKGLYTYSFNNEKMVNAILTMAIEIIAIYFALYKTRRYSDIVIDDKALVRRIVDKENYSKLGISSYAIILFTIAIFLMFPAVRNIYSFIFSGELDSLTYVTSSMMDSLPGGVGWLGSTFGEITRYILLENILLALFKENLKKQKKKYFFISIAIIMLNMIFVTSSMVISLLASIVLFFQVYILYPQDRKKFIKFSIILGEVAILAVIFSYLKNVLSYQSLSQMIQDYTNGYYNIYQAQCAYEKYNLGIIDKIMMLFLGDGIANISPINIFFHVVNSSDIFNNYLYGRKFNGGAVLPFVSQWTYYFTPVIGSFFSALPVIYAKKVEKKWRNGDGNILVLGMLSLVLALTPFMYNTPTFIHIITMSIIPLWVAAKANKIFAFKIRSKTFLT